MDNQNISVDIQKLTKEFEAQRNTLSAVIGLLMDLNNAVNEGFEKVNERLSVLEGKQGMQGVNSQLHEIKQELHKIQKAYPYDDLYNNIQSIQKGEA
jgi:hypothetical protein